MYRNFHLAVNGIIVKNKIVFNFLVKVISGKLTKNKEADDFYYFDYKKLPLNMPDKQKERILDYFQDKKYVWVKIQKGISSIGKLKKLK